MKFDMFFEPPAEISIKKGVSYSVKLIGGPSEYKEFLEQKKIKLEAQAKANSETYIVRKIISEGILLGEIEPSLYTPPPTLAIFKAYIFGKPIQQQFKVDVSCAGEHAPHSKDQFPHVKVSWFSENLNKLKTYWKV